tara:strand:+ start:322 stop:594 length:273 start_codon:yes stop_codon:yes gene_type:complete
MKTAFKLRSGNKPSIAKLLGVSPAKAADEALIEASKMGSEEAAETIANIDPISDFGVSSSEKTGDKKSKNNLLYRLAGPAGRAKMDAKNK